MKKFLKAVALATVMCMLLSVSAFAEVDANVTKTVTEDVANDQIAVSVTAGANEQVALLVVEHEATLETLTDAQIEYIGQETAGEDGVADFGTFTVKNADAIVDIYVGSTTLATARKIGEDVDLKGVSKITIVEGTKASVTQKAEGGKYGYAAAVTANIPENTTITAMRWAFLVGGDWKYSQIITEEISGALVEGGTQFAAAFNAYTESEEGFAAVTVDDFAVIFLTGEANADNTHYVGDAEDVAAIEAEGPYANNN